MISCLSEAMDEVSTVFRLCSSIRLPFQCSTLICGLDPFASILLRGSLIRGSKGRLIGRGMGESAQTSGNSFRQDQPMDKCCSVYRLDHEGEDVAVCTLTFDQVETDWADKLFSTVVPERVIVFCVMAYQNFIVTEPLTQTTPFLRYCCHPESHDKALSLQEVCSRLDAPNELTGAAQLVAGCCQDRSIPMVAYVCVTDSPRPDRKTLRQLLSALRMTPQLKSFVCSEQDIFSLLPSVQSDTPLYV